MIAHQHAKTESNQLLNYMLTVCKLLICNPASVVDGTPTFGRLTFHILPWVPSHRKNAII